MYERILVPLDGSELSEAVLPSVKDMAQRMGAQIILFQAVSPNLDRLVFPDEYSPTTYIDQELERVQLEAEVYLRKVAKELRAEGIVVRIVVGIGDPAEGILRTAEKVNADMIAMSTHGRTGLGRLIHGSVAAKVLRTTSRPVVLVRPESRVEQVA